MKNKGYNLDQLSSAIEQRKYFKDVLDRLLRELKIEEAKVSSKKEEVLQAEAALNKADRHVHDVINDLEQKND